MNIGLPEAFMSIQHRWYFCARWHPLQLARLTGKPSQENHLPSLLLRTCYHVLFYAKGRRSDSLGALISKPDLLRSHRA